MTQSGSGVDTNAMITVREVVRAVVTDVAPEELPVFEGLARFDDDTVVRRLSGRRQRREPLGFGLGEVVALVTPVVWLVLNQAAQRAAGAAVDGAAKGAKRLLRKVFGRPMPPEEMPRLNAAQRDKVRTTLLALLDEQGIDRARADRVADAVIKHLTRASGEDGGGEDGPAPGGER